VFDLFLNGMTTYGPLALGLSMLPGIVGVPVPVGVLLIAAGALVRQGLMDWQAVFLFAWLGALLGDTITYSLGRWAGGWFHAHLNGRLAAVWDQAEERFRNHAGWAIFLTGWLIRGLALPTNIIAGSSRYPFRRFLVWNAAGKFVWIILHAGLGYAFASQWQLVSDTISSIGGWLGLGTIIGIGIYLILRRLRAKKEYRVLEPPIEFGSETIGV
jgi:membrane-associated protein